MAKECYIGETVKLKFEIIKYKKKDKVTIKIYEKGNESNIIHQESLRKDEEGDVHFVYEWKVSYRGELSRLENETVTYAYKPFIGDEAGEEAEITLKADFYRLVFKYKDPFGGADRVFPDGLPVKISYLNGDNELKSLKLYTTKDNNGKIKILKPNPQAQGISFEIKFPEVTYINYSKDKLIGERELAMAMNSNVNYLAENRIFSLWEEHKLGDGEWKVSSGYDLGKKVITKVNEDVEIKLELKWKHIKFTYYDYQAAAEANLPQYPLVKATTKKSTKSNYCGFSSDDKFFAASNLYNSGVIYIPWKDRVKEPQLLFELEDDIFVKSNKLVTNETIATMRQKALPERIKHFHLPLKWRSKKWFVKFGNAEGPFKDKIGKETSEANPIAFNLSSVVLVDRDQNPVSWNKKDRFTVFDLEMKYVKGDTKAPYWHEKSDLKENFFTTDILEPGGFKAPRVIAANGKFYDITDIKTTKGDIIGARAAVYNDSRVHIKEKKSPLQYTGTGGFELHFFKECLDSSSKSDKECYALLTYWSCLLQEDKAHPGNTDNFKDPGMFNAKDRWECKGFQLKRKEGGGKELVKPVFFFEAREKDPKKMTIDIATSIPDDDRSYVEGSNYGKIMEDNYQPSAFGASTPYVRGRFINFALAHELGHAALGLEDEYIEAISEPYSGAGVWGDSKISRFEQWYPGMPYELDEESMMVTNKQPRMRHFWYLCRWLNETATIKSATNDSIYQVYDGVGKVDFFLEDKYNNYIKAYKESVNKKNGHAGKFDLYLYKISKNEAPGGSFISNFTEIDGILVVRTKINWSFENDGGNLWKQTVHTDADKNSNELKFNFIRDFQRKIDTDLNKKFYIESDVDGLKRIYVHFMVSHEFERLLLIRESEHFKITVKKTAQSSAQDNDFFFEERWYSKRKIIVGSSTEYVINIFRFTLGLDDDKTIKAANNQITEADLGFLAAWIKVQLNAGDDLSVKLAPGR